MSKIEWTDVTWNPVFNGTIRLMEDRLEQPLRWRKPRMVFVNPMSDLFHPDVPFRFIDLVFAAMALCPQHRFHVLTKRPERMAEYLTSNETKRRMIDLFRMRQVLHGAVIPSSWGHPPLPNIWIGTSVEDQDSADQRIPHLLRCPAAIRFLSCEPLLGAIDLRQVRDPKDESMSIFFPLSGEVISEGMNEPQRLAQGGVDWVIVGGESGPAARPCNIAWIRPIVEHCKAAGVPVFLKKLGSRPCEGDWKIRDPVRPREPGESQAE